MMEYQQRTVRIFVSSTFRDFQQERDLLVRQVFPALRKKLRQRHVELVDVDLRWGITEEEAQQGAVLPICLAEIDKSRPFFLGLLGERYGWVPEASVYAAALLQEQQWLQEHVGGKSVTELEILHGVLNNPAMAGQAFFYFRDPLWSSAQNHPDYLAENPQSSEKLKQLKQRIRQSAFPVVEDYADPQSLAERVEQELWAALDQSYPESETPDQLSRLAGKHEAYAAPRRRLFLGAEESLSRLEQLVAAGEPRLVVTGPSGNGKSALLANWAERHRQQHPADLLIEHYLGVDSDAAEPEEMLRRLLGELAQDRGVTVEIPQEQQELFEAFEQELADWALTFGSRQRRLLLLFDGLNQHSGQSHLPWLPDQLPQGVLLVASSLPGDTLQVLLKQGFVELALPPLGLKERESLTQQYLATYRKQLSPSQLQKVSSHRLSGNPLFLRTLLRELRFYGVFEELEQKLEELLESEGLSGLFNQVLAFNQAAEILLVQCDAGQCLRGFLQLGEGEFRWHQLEQHRPVFDLGAQAADGGGGNAAVVGGQRHAIGRAGFRRQRRAPVAVSFVHQSGGVEHFVAFERPFFVPGDGADAESQVHLLAPGAAPSKSARLAPGQ